MKSGNEVGVNIVDPRYVSSRARAKRTVLVLLIFFVIFHFNKSMQTYMYMTHTFFLKKGGIFSLGRISLDRNFPKGRIFREVISLGQAYLPTGEISEEGGFSGNCFPVEYS